MVEALLVFVVIILAMALTAGYFYFKQRLDKVELNIFNIETTPAFQEVITKPFTKNVSDAAKLVENEIEKTEPESIDITPENMHSIVTNKNIKIVREDVFSDEDNMVM